MTLFYIILPVIPSSMDKRNRSNPYLCLSLRVFKTYASTVESFPPDAPMATLLPGLNNLPLIIVS